MRNKKLFSILMSLFVALTFSMSLNTLNVFADPEPETYGEELSEDELLDLSEEADISVNDVSYDSSVTVTFILGGGLESVMVQDVSNAQVTDSGDLIIDDSLYQSVANGGTMTMNGGDGFAIKALDSGQQLRVVIAESSADATSESGTVAISRPGEALRAAILNENTWIYVTPGTFADTDATEDANGDLIWPLEGDEGTVEEITPDFPTAKQEIPYKVGHTYTGNAYTLHRYFNVGHSRSTFRHTSGILKDIGKDITCSCYDHDRGLGEVGTKFTYRCKVLKVNNDDRKIKVSIRYYPKSKSSTCWGYGTTVTTHRTTWPQRHKWTGWLTLKSHSGYIQAQKKSENQISSGLNTYSLEGAEYQVFTNEACTTAAQCEDGSEAILRTDATGMSPKKELEWGTYYVKEIKAPKGHARSDVVKKVIVNKKNKESNPVVFDYTDPERYGKIFINKLDLELDEFYSEGDARIETVKFEISYYDNNDGSGTPKRTWTFAIPDVDHNNKDLTEDMYVSGDALYKINGKMVFPLGYYKFKEITPEGYVPNDKIMEVALPDTKGNTSTETYVGHVGVERKNQVIRGGLEFEKHDAETRAHWPLGGASFKGTTFELINSSRHFIYYKKNGNFVLENGQPKKFEPGDVIDTFKVKEDGVAVSTDKDALPYGTYTIREVAVDDLEQKHGSYLPTEIENQTILKIKVRNDGTIHTTTDEVNNGNTQDYFYNYVKRGDINLVKYKTSDDQEYVANLKGIPFVIKSKTTGEAHVLVVLDNSGYTSTKNDLLQHTDNTNFNDYMIDENGMPKLDENGWVDTSKIDYYAGIWFGKDSKGNETLEVDNEKGALPYDTYELYELPCAINHKSQLYSGEFDITRHTLEYRANVPNPDLPLIGTQAKDSITLDNFGSGESDSIIDTIKYEKFLRGTYLVRTTLMDKETGEPIQVDGKDLVVEKNVTFGDGSGEVNVEIKFPKNHLKGKAVVVFEEVWNLDKDGNIIDSDVATTAMDPYAEHKSLKDEGQTVLYPDMHTTAKDKVDLEKDVFANGTQTIVDTVEYKALQPGKEHVLKGVLMDKATGEPLKDANGNEIRAEKTFTPETYNGTVDMEFTFDASLLEGKTVVVFEDLYRDGKEILLHADIEDVDQSIYLPKIRTKFMTNDGERDIDFSALNTEPTVNPGTEDPGTDPSQPSDPTQDPNAGLDVDKTKDLVVGQDIEAGYYKLTGHVPGTTGIAYWAVFFNKDGSIPTERDTDHAVTNGLLGDNETDIIRVENNMVLQISIASYGSITYEKITATDADITSPSMRTFYEFNWDNNTNTYKETAPVATASAKKAMAEAAQEANDAATESETPVVDEQPTETPAETPAEESGEAVVVLVDHVQYWNLIPGKEYEATVGIAKKDGTVLTDANGNPYEGHFTFVPETADGEYEVQLPPIPLSELKDDIVALEVLKSKPAKEEGSTEEPTPKVVAEHKDLTDADQTIMIPKVRTSAVDQADGDKAILGKPDQTLVDTMTYEGLIVGGNYIARGKLVNPNTGEYLVDESGKEVVAETAFVPTESSGTVEVVFNFDASECMAGSVVVFEELYRVPDDTSKPERLVGWHKDLTDTDQTLDVYMELYVTIAKADAEKIKYFLKGAEITVFDGDGNVALDKDGNKCVGITDKNGEVKFTLLYLEGMEYYAQETKAPKGYQINKDKFEVQPETLNEEGADILISILDQAIVIPPIKTGDDTNMMLYAILLLVALSAVGTTVFVRRRIKVNK